MSDDSAPATKADLERSETRLLEHMERIEMAMSERTEKVETTLLREFRKMGDQL